jgi:16S rRNA pseudouridine516 synthase
MNPSCLYLFIFVRNYDKIQEKERGKMEKQRLDKIIASTGKFSRREVKTLVRQGKVLVDGIPARSGEDKVDAESVEIVVNGECLTYRRYTWVMLNKPAGYLSATEDGHGATVLDLLPQELQKQGLFPVGRLDKDTEGLLLLTNEGGLAHNLLSPKHHVDKVYYTRVHGCLTEEDCRAFEAGMTLADGLVRQSAGLKILSAGNESEAYVTLREGKFHQVKRMLADRGKPVLYLERVKMGNLTLDPSLSRGEYRFLTEEEVELLRQNS